MYCKGFFYIVNNYFLGTNPNACVIVCGTCVAFLRGDDSRAKPRAIWFFACCVSLWVVFSYD